MRINKYLKEKGFSTRRGADELIAKGAVLINGKKARLGDDVTAKDEITLLGDRSGIREEKLYYIAYNKPIGILTNKDEAAGKDILSATTFRNDAGKDIRVFPVGRLDKDSYGLILLTNDGRVTDKLLSPRFLHEKEYLVTTDRPFNDFFLAKLAAGIRIDGSVTRKAKTERVSPNSFKIILTEGKKRQIRRMCEALHLDVVDLCRVRIMNIQLAKLKPGEYRHLSKDEKKTLLASLYIPEKETMLIAAKPRFDPKAPAPKADRNAAVKPVRSSRDSSKASKPKRPIKKPGSRPGARKTFTKYAKRK